MKLHGRIDRLDIYEDEEHVFVKVMDYKSGATAFDIVSVYHGLQLQLVLYMNAAVELLNKGKKEAVPAGIFYYNVKDPMEEWKEDESEDDLKMRILKDLKVNGLVQEDINVIHHLDRDIPDVTKDSLVLPIKLNKDGSFSANSSTASLERMQKLSEYVDQKVRIIGKEILEGNVAVNPYEKGMQTGCDYCPYQGICGFDGKIPGYSYRRLDKMKAQDVWEKIEQEAAEDGR